MYSVAAQLHSYSDVLIHMCSDVQRFYAEHLLIPPCLDFTYVPPLSFALPRLASSFRARTRTVAVTPVMSPFHIAARIVDIHQRVRKALVAFFSKVQVQVQAPRFAKDNIC